MNVYFSLLRIRHWLKNLILLVPFLSSANLFNLDEVFPLILCFFSFSIIASSGYVFNDIFDFPKDSRHPLKKNRPIPSGRISIIMAKKIGIILFFIGISLSLLISRDFFIICGVYLILSVLYSSKLKKIKFLDVFILSFFYVLRIFAGSFAINIYPSPWLISFAFIFFLSLCLFKRAIEYEIISNSGWSYNDYRPYEIMYKNIFRNAGIAMSIISIILLFLYLLIGLNPYLYANPSYLYLSLPLFLIWSVHIWFYRYHHIESDDLVKILLNDRLYLLIYFLTLLVLLISL